MLVLIVIELTLHFLVLHPRMSRGENFPVSWCNSLIFPPKNRVILRLSNKAGKLHRDNRKENRHKRTNNRTAAYLQASKGCFTAFQSASI